MTNYEVPSTQLAPLNSEQLTLGKQAKLDQIANTDDVDDAMAVHAHLRAQLFASLCMQLESLVCSIIRGKEHLEEVQRLCCPRDALQ